MLDETTHKDRLQRNPPPKGLSGILQSKEADSEVAESSCRAFGYLRGIRDQSAAVEFRFRNGNSTWFPYSNSRRRAGFGPWPARREQLGRCHGGLAGKNVRVGKTASLQIEASGQARVSGW